MRIRYRILFLGLVAIAWIAINLPASLVRHLVDPSAAAFVAPSGTVWQGASQIISPIGLRGEVQWEITLLRPGVNFALIHQNSFIQGRFELGMNNHRISLAGQVDTATLSPLLTRYDLFVPGTFDLTSTDLTLGPTGLFMTAPSELQWSGGRTRYILANRRYEALMPPLIAIIGARDNGVLEAKIKISAEETTPLLVLRLRPNGDVYLGVTRGMLRLANYPWSGNEAESDLIFEVERKLTQTST